MALYQQKLTTAVQHLKRLTAENEDLAAKLLVQRENGTIELSTSNHLDHPNSNNHAADDKLMAANFQELESSAQARIHQLKSEHALELQSVNNLVASQRETISRLEEQASSSQKVSALESEIQTLSATHQHAVKRLEALLDNKEQELVEVGLTVEDLDLKCDELQAKLDQLEPQAGIMKDRIALLELENTELVSKLQHGASAVAQASTTPSNSYSLALPPSFAHTPITTTSPHLSTGFDDGWGTEDIIDSPTPPSEQVVITTSSNSLSPDFTSEILPRKDHVSRLEIENKSLKQRIDDLEVLNEGFHSRTGNVGKSDGLDIAGYDTINTTPKDGHGQQQCLTLRIKELEDSNARLNEEIETLRELSAVQDDGWGDNTVSCSPSTSHSKPSISISTEVEESYKTKISGLESLVAALNQDVQRCELEVVRCKEELEQQRHLKTQDQHLNSRVKELEDTIAKLNEEIETLRDLSVVQDDGWGAGNNISSSSHTNPPTSISSEMEETYKTKISHLESLVSVRNQDVQRCELELDRCKEELEYTKASTSRALDDTNTLNKKFMELTSKDQQQHQLLQNEQQQVQHLTQLLTENAESNAAKEESLRSQQNEMKLELSRVQSIFQEKCNQLVSELGLSKGRLVEFEAEIAQVTAQRDTLEKELVRSRQLHLEESNRKLEEKDQALEDLSLEIAKLNQLIGSLEAAEAESKRQLDHLQSALSHSKSDYSRLNEALMSICQDRKDVATREPLITAEVVSRRIAQLESENKDLRTRQLADSAQISPASSSSKTIEAHLVGEIFAAIVAWLDNALQHSFTENGEYTGRRKRVTIWWVVRFAIS